MTDYTITNVRESEDLAAKHGLSEFQEARFPREQLGAETTGFIHLVLHPGKRQPFAHRHREAEEIYVVLSGSGRMKLDDELIEVKPLDAVRIGPSVTRMLEAGPDGLELLGFGPHYADDAEVVRDFWEE
jgi:mannose-6-phosphate isomerase-like protein (cupin superfamily)